VDLKYKDEANLRNAPGPLPDPVTSTRETERSDVDREHSRNYLDKIVVHNLLVTLRFVRSESLTTTTWFIKYIRINVVQTRRQLEDREIKIKISWIIYATPLIKWVITTKKHSALVVKLVDTKDLKAEGFTFTSMSDSVRQ